MLHIFNNYTFIFLKSIFTSKLLLYEIIFLSIITICNICLIFYLLSVISVPDETATTSNKEELSNQSNVEHQNVEPLNVSSHSQSFINAGKNYNKNIENRYFYIIFLVLVLYCFITVLVNL